MFKKAYLYNENKEFVKEVNAQLDPLSSKIENKEIYILPANSTFKQPLEPKEGFIVVFNGNDWEYQEIKIEEPEPYEPTYADLRLAEYPTIGDQLDMIYWDKINNTNVWVEKISEIKAKYPKD